MSRRVVITGMGALTPLGNDVSTTWAQAKAGVNGIAPITQYDATGRAVTLAGEVKDLVVSDSIAKRDMRKYARFSQLAMIASDEALADSGLDLSQEDTTRCGVVVSSGIGGLDVIADNQDRGNKLGFDKVSPYFIPLCITNMAAGNIAIRHGFQGSANCVVTACAGGTNAIGEAFRSIRDGYAEVMMCGGAEACITPLAIGGFTSMRALTHATDPNRASIPFDAERDGFVLSEGAGILVLEEYEHAQARGAEIVAEIVGYGSTCDAYHMTSPLPDGTGAARCFEAAIADANITNDDIDHINAHATSTSLNDKGETLAIKNVFGAHAQDILVTGTKSMTGHMLGATGAVEAIFTALSLKEGFIPPTINYQVADEDCDLTIVTGTGQEADMTYALSDSLGFGGHNAAIVLKKFGA